jgi:protease I
MSRVLAGKRIAFLATDGVEQVELTEPWGAMRDAGADVVLVSLDQDKVQGFDHLTPADSFDVDAKASEVDASTFDALVLPGGVANPDALRTDEAAVAFAREFVVSGRPVAAICHAPWTLVEADVVRGRRLTSWPSLRTDITNAGGEWVDERVVVDGNLVTSRKPDDLPAFCSALLEALEHGAASQEAPAS